MHRDLAQLEAQSFDVAIVGGGIHGAWIAWRAVCAGLRVALIEKHDFSGATSANSLKILHGGLRYLQHLDFARMRNSIRARREFSRLSPHLVRPLPCVMPLQSTGARSPLVLAPALLANDWVSFDRNFGVDARAQLPGGRVIGRRRCEQYLRPLADIRTAGGALWWDATATDTSRLVLEPLLMAAQAGAVIANRVAAQEYLRHDSSLTGLVAVDQVSGRQLTIKASVVVDAAGPWAGRWARNIKLPTSYLPPAWLGGINVVLKRSLGIEAAIALSSDSMIADHSAVLQRATRELFFVPWSGVTLVGTHYHAVSDPDTAVGPPAASVQSFVDEMGRVAPRARITMADVARVHWGLLPAAAHGAVLPSKAPVLVAGREQAGARGLVVVIGEKLTSAPTLSVAVLKRVHGELGRRGSARTQLELPCSNANQLDIEPAIEPRERLMARYGVGWQAVARLGVDRPELMIRIHPHVPVLGVEIVHAIRHEMALGLEDLVLRRLGLGDTGHPGTDVLRCCADLAGPEFGWSQAEIERSVAEFDQIGSR